MPASQNIVEPKDFTEAMYDAPGMDHLNDFMAMVKRGEPWRIPTERLLRLNGNSRRGKIVNQEINDNLKRHGLVCKPAVENADYYGQVIISDPRDEIKNPEVVASLPISAFRGELPDLIWCGPEVSAKKIKTLMIRYDLSQIPVLSGGKKNLLGVVTWRSFAQYRGDMVDAKALDVKESSGHVASSSDDFLDLVDTIIGQGYLLYRTPDGCVDGIVTASDLAQAFNSTAGIYIQLQEVESRLRILLDKSPIPKLKEHLDPKRRNMNKFRGATDMTFGEYLSALADEHIWVATHIDLDHDACLKLFDDLRNIRNGVMHFSSGREDVTASVLSDQTVVTQSLRILRATPLT